MWVGRLKYIVGRNLHTHTHTHTPPPPPPPPPTTTTTKLFKEKQKTFKVFSSDSETKLALAAKSSCQELK